MRSLRNILWSTYVPERYYTQGSMDGINWVNVEVNIPGILTFNRQTTPGMFDLDPVAGLVSAIWTALKATSPRPSAEGAWSSSFSFIDAELDELYPR